MLVPVLLTTKEVAAVLRVHPKHVYRLLKRGLPAHRVGDEWRFDRAEVLRWAASAGTDTPPTSSESTGPASIARAEPLLAANGDLVIEALLDGTRDAGAPLLGCVQADHQTGLDLLRRGHVLLAGCHGDAAPTLAAQEKLAWLHLATRTLGLAFARGRRVRRLSFVVGRRFASRPPTAGIRARFDESLAREGVSPETAHAGATLYASHRDAVLAVVRGDAEVALASSAWASRAGLAFLPIVTEGYGLALHASDLGDPRVVALAERAQSAAYRRQLECEIGYDARRTGEVRFTAGVGLGT